MEYQNIVHEFADRLLAESFVRDSERRLRDIIDSIPALVGYCDAKERCLFFNTSAIQLLKLDARRLSTYRLRDALGDASYAIYEPHVKSVLAGDRTSFEAKLAHGMPAAQFMTHLVPDKSNSGLVVGFHWTSFDITALTAADFERAQSDRRLRSITDNIPAVISHFDVDERCDFTNRVASELYGRDHRELIGKTIREVRGEGSYAQTYKYVHAVLAGERVNYERQVTIDGRERFLQQSYVLDVGVDGAVQGFYSVSVDITERKNSERRLASSEKLLRAVTDNMPVLISYIDAQEKIRFLNATFKTWMGLEVEQAIGRPLVEVVGQRLYDQRIDYLKRSMAGERVEFEVDSNLNGVERSLHNVYLPDLVNDGSVAGVYTLSTDVTALKRVERQLSALARLDSLTGLPNRHQFNERLVEALRRAQRSADAIALMFLDVDNFKAINDSLGHAAGDAVLKEIALRILAAIRTTDCAARLAGDEFVIILEGLGSALESQVVARKILAQINRPFDIDENHLSVSTSIGIAFHRGGVISPCELLATADQALYEAKAAGRNTYRMKDSGVSGPLS